MHASMNFRIVLVASGKAVNAQVQHLLQSQNSKSMNPRDRMQPLHQMIIQRAQCSGFLSAVCKHLGLVPAGLHYLLSMQLGKASSSCWNAVSSTTDGNTFFHF